MNFLGIGPGELLFIIILLLVVVGPERLPGMARQAGQMLVRARNWLQSSPDAALVLRARQEIEQELAQLRTNLLEVQSVRDEVLGVAKQIDEAVSPITQVRAPSLNELINPPAQQTFSRDSDQAAPAIDESPASEAAPAEVAPADVQGDADIETLPADEAGADIAPELMPDLEAAPEAVSQLAQNGTALAEPTGNGIRHPPTDEIEALGLRIQAVMADLFALQEQLKLRGLLANDWQPPSHEMQLPQPDAPIEEVDR